MIVTAFPSANEDASVPCSRVWSIGAQSRLRIAPCRPLVARSSSVPASLAASFLALSSRRAAWRASCSGESWKGASRFSLGGITGVSGMTESIFCWPVNVRAPPGAKWQWMREKRIRRRTSVVILIDQKKGDMHECSTVESKVVFRPRLCVYPVVVVITIDSRAAAARAEKRKRI